MGDALVPAELGGLVEIRIHGVSGTSVSSMLETSDTLQVAGDAVSGFHRRRAWTGYGPAEAGKEVGGPKPLRRHLEAYTWGGLTSGAASRAFWLLLLPFTFVNVAAWAYPSGGTDRRTPWRLARIKALLAALRLLGISLTVLLLLAASGVAQDVVGWQCGNRQQCFADRRIRGGAVLGFLGEQSPGPRLVLTSLLPLLVLGLLWQLGSATWKQYDQTLMPASDQDDDSPDAVRQTYVRSPFADRRFWSCRNSIARLRSLHVATGLCTVLLATALPVLLAPGARAPWLVAGPLAAIIAGSLVLACVPAVADVTTEIDRRDASPLNGLPKVLRIAAIVMAPIVLTYVWRSDVFRADTRLPGYDVVVALVVGFQVLMLLAVLALSWAGRELRVESLDELEADWPAPAAPDGAEETSRPPLCHGLATPAFATLGCFLAVIFSAGVAYAMAAFVGTPESRPGEAAAEPLGLVASRLYDWVAASYVFMVAALAVLLLAVVLHHIGVRVDREGGGRRVRFGIRRGVVARHEAAVRADYGRVAEPEEPHHVRDRVRQLATVRWLAGLTDSGHRAVSALALLGALVVLASILLTALTNQWIAVDVLGAGAARRWLGGQRRLDAIRTLVPIGTGLVVGTMTALVGAGLAAYRNVATRRSIGILWDLATFWPRAAHPLAPPCYSDRTVPQLSKRIADVVAAGGTALVSAHSQGTVIAHATLLGVDQQTLDRTALITHGSPLTRLYSRGFPAYFGRWSMEALRERLTAVDGTSRWLNCWRKTDYLGRWIGRERAGLNVCILEPSFDPAAGDVLLPAAQMHSNYYSEPVYDVCVRELESRLGMPNPTPAPPYPFMSGGD